MKIVIIIVVIIIIIIIIYFAHGCNSHVTVVQKAITMSRNSKGGLNTALTSAADTHTHMQGRIKTQLGVMLQQWRHQAMPTPSPPLPLPLLLSFLSL